MCHISAFFFLERKEKDYISAKIECNFQKSLTMKIESRPVKINLIKVSCYTFIESNFEKKSK